MGCFVSKSNLSDRFHLRKMKKGFSAFRRDYLLYLMIIPGVFFFILFHYIPMYGISIAFRDYTIFRGFEDAPFIGLAHFRRLFTLPDFKSALLNTIIISFGKVIIGFPAPIILSLLINEVIHRKYKKFVQTAVLLPNFISWVVVAGLLQTLLSPTTGVIGEITRLIGYKDRVINVMVSREHFRSVIILSSVWKTMGMGTIIYLAAISGIDTELYEAAIVDGAGRWRQIWHITLTSLRPTIVVLLIFRVGVLLNAGFEQILVMQNPLVYSVSEIIDTYVYKIGMIQSQFSLATAAGFFKSIVGLILVILTNNVAKKIDPDSGIM
jgi:putative aldouronate transport system permease protein